VPLILRIVRKTRWEGEKPSWLEKGEFHAEPLGDFMTSANSLSAWRIEDDQSNLQRVITALAANRARVANFDYVLFDGELLTVCHIKVEHTKGDSPDEEVNAWHFDLIELSAQKLVKLVEAVWEKKTEVKRISHKEIRNWILQAKELGQLEPDQIRVKNI